MDEFGVGINERWIPIHDLISVLGIKSAGHLFWYALTGCDAVSAFRGKGKLSAWTTWRVFDDITPVFEKYSHHSQHNQIKDEGIRILERFTCLLYSRTLTFQSVNEFDALYLPNNAVKLTPSHQQKMLFCNTLSVLCIKQV